MEKNNKKAVAAVPNILIIFLTVVIIMGIVGIAMVYMGDIMSDVQDDYVTNTAGCNATVTTACGTAYDIADNSVDSQLELSEKNDSIANVVVAGIIIAVLLAAFGGFFGGRLLG